MLDTALYLYCLRCFITEAFDKVFRILYLFLLIFVSTELLFATFFAENDKLIILHLIVINLPASNLNRTGSYIIKKGTVVTDQYNGIGTGRQKVLQPLNTFNIKMIGRLIEQKYVRTAKQQLRKFDTHTPTTGKFRSRAFEVLTAEAQS